MNKLAEAAFKLRGGVWTTLFAAMLLTSSLTAPTGRACLWAGLLFVTLGQALRFWAVCCVGRYRGERVGAERLATWGPYAIVRNPLYDGNFLIGFGWGMMAGVVPLLLFFIVFILLYTVLIVPHEEAFLAGKFGAEYEDYRRRAGRFLPKMSVFCHAPPGIRGPLDVRVLWTSERHSLLMTVAGTVLLLIVRMI
ncbi:MAG: isoprenylcysteine carboxylmethyltransferase family protein [Synergistaceae bacterium]|jgi:protein-S-isoprenylcysteine O-methyltransferase Ste14|nr:isoprenylcysteine carboxylmethyltransferase family protein [Synergistaceae bacterium]